MNYYGSASRPFHWMNRVQLLTSLQIIKENNRTSVTYEMISANWYLEDKFLHNNFDKLFVYAHSQTTVIRNYFIPIVVFLIGFIRILQGLYNEAAVSFLIMEMILGGVGLFWMITYFSIKYQVYKWAKAYYKELERYKNLYTDAVIPKFVNDGSPSLAGFAEGALLTAIFTAAYRNLLPQEITGYGGSIGCGSCGGGGGCSGGGGCGGGGCGGCGGD